MYVPNLNFTWTLRNNFSHFQKGPQKKSSRVLDPLNFTWTPRNYFLHFQKGPQKFSWTPRILEPALPLLQISNGAPLTNIKNLIWDIIDDPSRLERDSHSQNQNKSLRNELVPN